MKIISNFQDYYDGCAFYCAEDIVYNRQTDNGENVNKYRSVGIIYERDEKLLEDLNKVFKYYYSNIYMIIMEQEQKKKEQGVFISSLIVLKKKNHY